MRDLSAPLCDLSERASLTSLPPLVGAERQTGETERSALWPLTPTAATAAAVPPAEPLRRDRAA